MKLPAQHELLSKARLWSKRRLILLASVAAIGTGVMLASPAYPPVTLNGTPAHAEMVNAMAAQPQAGFADLIEQVKPAVVSVRVKKVADDQTTGQGSSMERFGDNEGMQRFFRQFGTPDAPNSRAIFAVRSLLPQSTTTISSATPASEAKARGRLCSSFSVIRQAERRFISLRPL